MESLAKDKSYKAKRVRTSRKTNVASSSKKIDPEPEDNLFHELDDLVEEIKKEDEKMSQVQNKSQNIVEEKTSTSKDKSTDKLKMAGQKKAGKAKGNKKKVTSDTYIEDSDFEVNKPKKKRTEVSKQKNKTDNDCSNLDTSRTENAKGKKPKKVKNADKVTPVKQVEKGEKKAEDSADDIILDYLKTTNRPYSLINIFDNLKGRIKKPVIQKSLDDLVDQQLIEKKDFKKMAVYYYNQRNIVVDQEIISEARQKLENIKEDYTAAMTQNKELRNKLINVEKEETTEKIESLVGQLNVDIPVLRKKLNIFKDKNAEIVPEHVIDDKTKSVEELELMLKKRRRIFKTMFDTIQEQTGMKTEELYETLGIETL